MDSVHPQYPWHCLADSTLDVSIEYFFLFLLLYVRAVSSKQGALALGPGSLLNPMDARRRCGYV